jgi:hypothetical protein
MGHKTIQKDLRESVRLYPLKYMDSIEISSQENNRLLNEPTSVKKSHSNEIKF